MKFKPAMGAVAAAPILLLLTLAGGLRGMAYLQGTPTEAQALAVTARQNVPAPPQNADKATAAMLQKVAGAQIAALQKRDWKKAVALAQPEMRQQWSPDAFGKMIDSGYAELTQAKTVTFGQAQTAQEGNVAFLPVTVSDAQKKTTSFLYILTRAPAALTPSNAQPKNAKGAKQAAKPGAWHISGCQRVNPLPPPAPVNLEMA